MPAPQAPLPCTPRPRRAAIALLLACLWGTHDHAQAGAAAPSPPRALFPVRAGDLQGLIDANGRTVVPAEFAEVVVGDPLIMVRKGSRTAYFDSQGRMVVAPQDNLSQPYSAGLVPAPSRDAQGRLRWGYADATGRIVIDAVYEEAGPFFDGLAVVGVADAWGELRYGVIDRNGRRVLQAVHAKLLPPAGGLVRSQSKERTHRVFDAQGRDITPAEVDFVGIPSDGMVRVWKGRLQGYMTTGGELRVPPRYEGASDFKEGRARVWVQGKYGYIDKQGTLVVPARYDSAEDYSDGLALVRQEGRSLFIDPAGQVQLQPQAERVWPFSGGLAAIKVDKLHGYIDKRGNAVIAPQFGFARPFSQGLAFVGSGRASGYINAQGQFVWRSDAP